MINATKYYEELHKIYYAETKGLSFVNQEEFAYMLHMRDLLEHGYETGDRTGTGTRSIFGHQLRFSLTDNTLPVITTKKIHLPSAIGELLWFISGSTNINDLKAIHPNRIWDEWADEEGELGPVYGNQWRKWRTPFGITIDQLGFAIDLLKKDPDSRRIIVNSWNVPDLPLMALQPCHMMFQFKSYDIGGQRHLHCHMYQRSADWFLGVPFNITSYALLTHMVARITNHTAAELVISFGDTHLYNNHVEQAEQQLDRAPYLFPKVKFHGTQLTIDDFMYDDIEVVNYEHHPLIKGKVSV